jgi:hypothetical protein
MAAVSTSFSFSQQKEYSLPLTVSTPFDATSAGEGGFVSLSNGICSLLLQGKQSE